MTKLIAFDGARKFAGDDGQRNTGKVAATLDKFSATGTRRALMRDRQP